MPPLNPGSNHDGEEKWARRSSFIIIIPEEPTRLRIEKFASVAIIDIYRHIVQT
jgi:hypothetical protein